MIAKPTRYILLWPHTFEPNIYVEIKGIIIKPNTMVIKPRIKDIFLFNISHAPNNFLTNNYFYLIIFFPMNTKFNSVTNLSISETILLNISIPIS